MSKRKCNAVSQLRKLKKSQHHLKQATTERLMHHQDRLSNMLACHQFIDDAVLAITDPERLGEFEDCHLGLFLCQQWIKQQGEELIDEVTTIKQSLNT
jgi:hypothetical protein